MWGLPGNWRANREEPNRIQVDLVNPHRDQGRQDITQSFIKYSHGAHGYTIAFFFL